MSARVRRAARHFLGSGHTTIVVGDTEERLVFCRDAFVLVEPAGHVLRLAE